ncbi:MAG: PilZ domain-containing protein [Spirochaetales bacterium]|nr:PilZ domain-containing protein [Spirochaetales bacterium]
MGNSRLTDNLPDLPAAMRGFSRKPPFIVLFALLYLLLPISNIVFFVLRSDIGPNVLFTTFFRGVFIHHNVFLSITLLLWLTAPFIALGLYRVRLWAWYGFIGHATLMIFSSSYRFLSAELELSPAFILNVLVLIPAIFFLQKEIRRPYFNPRLRWWEQHPRLKQMLQVRLAWNEYVFDEKTYDLAPDGIFVQTENLSDVAVGYFFNITIYFQGEPTDPLSSRPVHVQGIVVWIQFEPEAFPCGYGVKFLGLADSERRRISSFIKAGLKKIEAAPA